MCTQPDRKFWAAFLDEPSVLVHSSMHAPDYHLYLARSTDNYSSLFGWLLDIRCLIGDRLIFGKIGVERGLVPFVWDGHEFDGRWRCKKWQRISLNVGFSCLWNTCSGVSTV